MKHRRASRRGSARSPVWLFDLDNTLHDASHAAFMPISAAMTGYIVEHVGLDEVAATSLRQEYWLRYGATLLGMVRHHAVGAAHFLEQTHRLPGLEERLRTSAHDRAALRRLCGRKYVLTNAPRHYAQRVLRALRLESAFDGVIAIEDMAMFGQLRPKPDVRMLRRVAARLRTPPQSMRAGRGHARAPEGRTRTRHANRLDAALSGWTVSRAGGHAHTQPRAACRSRRSPLPETSLRVCQNQVVANVAPGLMSTSADLPEIRADAHGEVGTPAKAESQSGAPARKRPKPGERRVQILQTLARMLEQPGAERVTTAALAARLEVSEAALYRHFASKAQMFEGLIEFIEQTVFTLVNQITERETDARAQVEKVLAVVLQFGEKNPGMTRVMVGDALVFENDRLLTRMNQFFDRIESQLRQSLRTLAETSASDTPSVDANAQASALTAFLVGRLQRFARSGFKRIPTEHLEVVMQLFAGPRKS